MQASSAFNYFVPNEYRRAPEHPVIRTINPEGRFISAVNAKSAVFC
jgi:hypothetical protein